MKLIASIVTATLGTCLGLASVAQAAGLDEIPADIQKRLYAKEVLDPQQPIGPSAYRDWKPKKGPPWTIGYASSYADNTWRAAGFCRIKQISAN